MGDLMSATEVLARLRIDAASEDFEGAQLGPVAVRKLLKHIAALESDRWRQLCRIHSNRADTLRRERDELAARLEEIEQPETAEPAEQIDAGDPDDRIATTDQRTRALDLAASLRAMRRAALPHYSATGQQRHAVVMDSIRIGDLTDAADLIEQMVAAQQPKQES